MIELVTGSIFDSPASILVNPVSATGIMNTGISKEFKQRFPDMTLYYKEQCKKQNCYPGNLLFWNYVIAPRVKSICLFPTKTYWYSPPKLEYIEIGLRDLCEKASCIYPVIISMPKLGCGLGGLSFTHEVYPLMKRVFDKFSDITCYVHI